MLHGSQQREVSTAVSPLSYRKGALRLVLLARALGLREPDEGIVNQGNRAALDMSRRPLHSPGVNRNKLMLLEHLL